MNHWNYRVVRGKISGRDILGIHEVYYDDDDEIMTYTEAPEEWVTLEECDNNEAKALESLQKTLEWKLQAIKSPILSENDVT